MESKKDYRNTAHPRIEQGGKQTDGKYLFRLYYNEEKKDNGYEACYVDVRKDSPEIPSLFAFASALSDAGLTTENIQSIIA